MKKNINYLLFLFIFIIVNKINATNIEILAKINNQIITNIDLEKELKKNSEISFHNFIVLFFTNYSS